MVCPSWTCPVPGGQRGGATPRLLTPLMVGRQRMGTGRPCCRSEAGLPGACGRLAVSASPGAEPCWLGSSAHEKPGSGQDHLAFHSGTAFCSQAASSSGDRCFVRVKCVWQKGWSSRAGCSQMDVPQWLQGRGIVYNHAWDPSFLSDWEGAPCRQARRACLTSGGRACSSRKCLQVHAFTSYHGWYLKEDVERVEMIKVRTEGACEPPASTSASAKGSSFDPAQIPSSCSASTSLRGAWFYLQEVMSRECCEGMWLSVCIMLWRWRVLSIVIWDGNKIKQNMFGAAVQAKSIFS